MPARKFERIALELMLSGCAIMFGACVLIESAQAQQPSVPTGPIPAPPRPLRGAHLALLLRLFTLCSYRCRGAAPGLQGVGPVVARLL